MFRASIIVGLALALASAGAIARQADPEMTDAAQVASAKISLDAAVVAAQRHVQGKAVRAEYEKQKDGRWAYEVEVAAGAKIFDVKVDADQGTVMSSKEDANDRDDDRKKDD